jgi:protein-S-isoprenylcysteine O-methyltransferase Ste14
MNHGPARTTSLMFNADILLYGAHIVFWGSFGITRMLVRFPAPSQEESGSPIAQREHTARFSLAMLAIHTVAFATLYFGIADAIRSNRVPSWFAGQRVVSGVLIGLGIMLVSWALAFLRSWRLRAKIAPGHQLTTDGPFRFLRHPIYMALNLLALGTAFWVPTATVWAAFVLVVIGSDVRARAEEAVLARAFGAAYTDYSARTKRFIPGVY